MKHLGDITKLHGYDIPVVDVITGGSPCQDLSVAGKRAGLGGERSGLFMEQIRIVKEMREHDRRDNNRSGFMVRPRYMVWENVPGALSSPGGENKGKDFQAVLTEIARISEPECPDVPMPDKGKWPKSGCIYDDMGEWSIAWRVHDAQFWGVPQRRKRIALVADFGGSTAPEILFERKGMSRDTEESGKERQSVASDVGSGTQETGRAISFQERAGKPGGGKGILIQNERTGALSTLNNQSVCAFEPGAASRVGGHVYEDDKAGTVRANAGDNQQAVVYGISSDGSNAMRSDNPHSGIYEAETARTLDLNGGSPACNQGGMAVVESAGLDSFNQAMSEEVASTIRCAEGGDSTPKVCYRKTSHAKSKEDGQGWAETEVNDTLNAFDSGENRTPTVVVAIENHPNDSRVKISEDGMVQTLSSRMGTGGGNVPMVMEEPYNATTGSYMRAGNSGVAETLAARDYKDPQIVYNSVVRRLMPMECERLQGFPDGWTDIGEWTDSKGKRHKPADSPRYKALGNSIATPFWFWLLRRLSAQYERPATLGSLFDGIGGFPYCWERCNGRGTAIWASEIEEFPIAVTKVHFPEE